jgi:hypothetical protein
MMWLKTTCADKRGCALADRHYSRVKPGSNQFMPPGRQCVLITEAGDAVWGSAWPYAQYVRRVFPGAWVCTIFRNESTILSSDLIRDAVAATRYYWGDPPDEGMVTLIDVQKVRQKRDPGYCYRKAGFTVADPSHTKGGLLILRLDPSDMPEPQPAHGMTPEEDVIQCRRSTAARPSSRPAS